MKKAFWAALSLILIMSCTKTNESGYVGPAEVNIENGQMTPETLLSLGRLSDPQMSPDGSKILYGVSYISIAQNKSCRNLFICNPDGSGKVQLTRYAKSVNAARWSNDGKFIYFLQGGQLWKAPFLGSKLGKKEALSDVPNGISDYKISPDGNSLYYVSTIPGPVTSPKDTDPALDKAQAYVTEDLMYRHWDHWVTETPRTYVSTFNSLITPDSSFDILGTGDPGYELPTEPFGGAEQLDWSPTGRYIVYSCRKKTGIEYAFSTNTSIYIYDIVTGATLEVTGKGGYDTDPVWSPDGNSIAFISMERDGYEADRQRIMVADLAFSSEEEGQSFGLEVKGIRELTEGFIYDASGLVWTADSKSIIFASTIDSIGALCIADAVGEAGIRRLTKPEWWLGFSSPFSCDTENGAFTLYTTYMSMEFPTEIVKLELSDPEDPTYEQISHENDAILAQIDGIKMENIVLKSSNGEDLHCWVLYPPLFDESKNWPGIEMFNGGPQTSLDQSWSYRWNFRLMAQQGYVVILPNRHGDSGFGQPWKEQISGDYQGLNMDDYQIAGRWFKSQPWAGKLAGVGASYGGFSVYNMMGIHEDLYDCFISHAGIFNEKQMWYTTEEAWFGNWDNGGLTEYAYEPGKIGPAGDGITFGGLQQAGAPYATGAKVKEHYGNDPEAKVTKWHTPILCIHGMMDFRIPYEQGMAAFAAAKMMGCPAKLIIFPEECHWILQPQNALFWHREFYEWLDQWMN